MDARLWCGTLKNAVRANTASRKHIKYMWTLLPSLDLADRIWDCTLYWEELRRIATDQALRACHASVGGLKGAARESRTD